MMSPAMDVEVKKVFVIESKAMSDWRPETKEVDDITFFKVNKWDRKLTLFVTEKGLMFAKKNGKTAVNNISCGFFTYLKKKRESAFKLDLERAVAHEGDDDEEQPAKKRRKLKQRRLRDSDSALCSPYLEIELKEYDYNGIEVRPLRVKMLFGVRSEAFWIELSSDVLKYIKIAILSSKNTGAEPGGEDEDDDEDDEDDKENTQPDASE